ncbi:MULTISPECIES: zinc ribbon domain-containing protein [unclassified Microcoleus]|uniref:zinc ribbon domain-containing protein n=1 Tax=unclassified Microcoleus TaxID=2642155 RepID=UPI00404093A3
MGSLARYTSKMCHKCNHIHPGRGESYRTGKKFACDHCGWKGDADLNGSKNIAAIGAFVNKPEGSRLFCNVQDYFRAIESPHCACTQGACWVIYQALLQST